MPIVVGTADPSGLIDAEGLQRRAYTVVGKPFNADELLQPVATALRTWCGLLWLHPRVPSESSEPDQPCS